MRTSLLHLMILTPWSAKVSQQDFDGWSSWSGDNLIRNTNDHPHQWCLVGKCLQSSSCECHQVQRSWTPCKHPFSGWASLCLRWWFSGCGCRWTSCDLRENILAHLTIWMRLIIQNCNIQRGKTFHKVGRMSEHDFECSAAVTCAENVNMWRITSQSYIDKFRYKRTLDLQETNTNTEFTYVLY